MNANVKWDSLTGDIAGDAFLDRSASFVQIQAEELLSKKNTRLSSFFTLTKHDAIVKAYSLTLKL